jgi:sulfite reductase (NADPH) hemoprotein beta-component
VPDVIENVLDTYRRVRQSEERFIATLRRVGVEPFKQAAHQARHNLEVQAEVTA